MNMEMRILISPKVHSDIQRAIWINIVTFLKETLKVIKLVKIYAELKMVFKLTLIAHR